MPFYIDHKTCIQWWFNSDEEKPVTRSNVLENYANSYMRSGNQLYYLANVGSIS
jgi:hypothetical protein